MSDVVPFDEQVARNIHSLSRDTELQVESMRWVERTGRHRYSYNFTWMGRPIIQLPQDIVAAQEIIWRVKPELIIETGIAHGGSLIFSASMLHLLGGRGQVVGIDVEIRPHNRVEIEKHPTAGRITMIEGSSIAPDVVAQVRAIAEGRSPVLLILDSNHTHDHVLRELELYSPLVTSGSYLIVFDTAIEHMPEDFFPDRPWGKGNNPMTAVRAFLQETDRFEIDREMQNKLLITVAPEGYLRCIKD